MNNEPVQSSLPPASRLPRRMKFFAVTDAAGKKATVEMPSVQALNPRANGFHQQESWPPVLQTGPYPQIPRHMVMPHAQGLQQPELPAASLLDEQGRAGEGTRSGKRAQTWRPGTFGFDSVGDDTSEFWQRYTLPMMVLRDISVRQGQPVPTMQSEVSGAAGEAAVVGIGNIAANILRYVATLIIQRGFGPALFGLYSISMSVVTLVASVFNLGLDDAMVRYTSIYRGKQQPRSLVGLAVFSTLITGVMGIIGALVVLFLAPAFATLKHAPGVVPLLQVMSPLVPFLCMQVIWSGGLQGFKAFKWRVLSQRIIPTVVLIVLLICIFLVIRGNQKNHLVIAVAMATLASTMVGVVLEFYFLFRMVGRIAKPGPESYDIREWLGFAFPNFLTAIIDTILESIDTLLLAFYAVANTAIGQYNAALKITTFISVPLLSLNAMFAPTIAELYSKGEMQKLVAMFKTVTKWSITLSLPIFLIATIFSAPLLGISGPGYIPAWPLLVALSLGNIVNTATGSVGNMLLMTGHQKLSFLNSLTAVVVNVALGILLTPRYGAMGAAISTGIAYAVVNLMRLFQVRILLKIQPYRWDVLKPLAAGAVSAAITGGLLYLMGYLHLSLQLGHADLSLQLLLIPVFLALYGWLLALLKLSPDDQIVVDRFRKKFLSGRTKKGSGKKR